MFSGLTAKALYGSRLRICRRLLVGLCSRADGCCQTGVLWDTTFYDKGKACLSRIHQKITLRPLKNLPKGQRCITDLVAFDSNGEVRFSSCLFCLRYIINLSILKKAYRNPTKHSLKISQSPSSAFLPKENPKKVNPIYEKGSHIPIMH